MAAQKWHARQKEWWAGMRASYGTGDWAIFTMVLWKFCSRFLPGFSKVHLRSQISARDVLWENLWKPPFMRRIVVPRRSLREFTQTCVDLSQQLWQQSTGIMWYLLMNFLVSAGSSSCRRRARHTQSSVSSRHWLRKNRGSRWRLWGATMVVNSSLANSRTFVAQKEYEESL